MANGLPALPGAQGSVPAVTQLLASDAPNLFSGLAGPAWGLFLNNSPVVTAESVVSFDFKKSASISSFQVENGGFESYNKVQKPFDVRIRFATGGTPADRQALLESAQAAVKSLDLMDAVTPSAVYANVNPVHLDYRQTSDKGVGLIQVDIFCEEVRVLASSTFTTNTNVTGTGAPNSVGNTASANQAVSDRFLTTAPIVAPASPSAAPVVSNGTVQPIPAAPGQFDLSSSIPMSGF